jgi:RNA polymerase sigma factor (sigma-70 family)
MSRTIGGNESTSFKIRSLTKRFRPQHIVDQLNQLVGLEWPLVQRKVAIRNVPTELARETLVAMIRSYTALGQRDNADKVFIALIERVSGAIAQRLVKWRSISGSDMEDTRQSVIVGLHDYIYSLEVGEELWECNFKTCFDLRLLNVFGKLTKGKVQIAQSISQPSSEEEGIDSFDFPDESAQIPFDSVHVKDALAHLNGLNPRLGKVFYLKFFADIPDGEIAGMFEVSERTIRNWVSVSRRHLQEYYAEL